MKTKLSIFAMLVALVFVGCDEKKCPECEPTPPSEEACMKMYQEKLTSFEKEQSYEVRKPRFIVIEDDIMIMATRVSMDEEFFSKSPSGEGQTVGTVYVKPKAGADVKEGVYQAMLVPDEKMENVASIKFKGSNGKITSMALVNQTFTTAVVGPHVVGPGDGPCFTGQRCPTKSAAIQQLFKSTANSRCKIIRVNTRCQLYFQAGAMCFWITRYEPVFPDPAVCPPPAGGYQVDTYSPWYF